MDLAYSKVKPNKKSEESKIKGNVVEEGIQNWINQESIIKGNVDEEVYQN